MLFAYRRLDDYPLVVAYGISLDSVRAGWRPSFLMILAIAAASSLGLITSSLAVLQGQRTVRPARKPARSGNRTAARGRGGDAPARSKRRCGPIPRSPASSP
ncbi:MAG: hypothetical protein WDN69_14975 [Aliidongia sp.]